MSYSKPNSGKTCSVHAKEHWSLDLAGNFSDFDFQIAGPLVQQLYLSVEYIWTDYSDKFKLKSIFSHNISLK